MFSFFFPQTLARRIKRVTMSFNTKTSKYIFQNGHYVGQYYNKSKFFIAMTVESRSAYHTVQELIVIVQGCYQVSTYNLVMTERHFNRARKVEQICTVSSIHLSFFFQRYANLKTCYWKSDVCQSTLTKPGVEEPACWMKPRLRVRLEKSLWLQLSKKSSVFQFQALF